MHNQRLLSTVFRAPGTGREGTLAGGGVTKIFVVERAALSNVEFARPEHLRLLWLVFPPRGPRRLLIFRDGNENAGDAAAMARQAFGEKIRIDCFLPPKRERAETVLRKLDLPDEVKASE